MEVLRIKNQKTVMIHLVSLCILCAGLMLCRYALFDIHGMKQLPWQLFVCGVAIIGISFFVKAKRAAVFTAVSHIVGFWAGVFFQSDGVDAGGGRGNDFWIIWTAVFAGCIALATAGELIAAAKKRPDRKIPP